VSLDRRDAEQAQQVPGYLIGGRGVVAVGMIMQLRLVDRDLRVLAEFRP
jgi:hypothetical protein